MKNKENVEIDPSRIILTALENARYIAPTWRIVNLFE